MRMLMTVKMDTTQFNATIKGGNASKMMSRILEESKPEAAYFTDEEGCRTAILVVNVEDASNIPRLAEPWFLSFNAKIKFQICMIQDDLRKSGLDDLGRKWG